MTYLHLAYRIAIAEKMANNNNGVLPRMKDIKKIDVATYHAIINNPDAFAHIPREFERSAPRSPEEMVALARKIAAENPEDPGKLPKNADLAQIDRALSAFTFKRPELFSDIPRAKYLKRRAKAVAEAVKEMEAIAEANGGFIEITLKFQEANPKLTMVYRRNPEAFAHIPRKCRVVATIEEHQATAQRLMDENGGVMPPDSVLRAKYGALRSAMLRSPEKFPMVKRPAKNASEETDTAPDTAPDTAEPQNPD